MGEEMAGAAKGMKVRSKPKLVREPSEKGVFRYRSKLVFGLAAVVLPLTALLSGLFLWSYLSGEQTTVNGISEPTPLYAPFLAGALVLPWWIFFGYSILRYYNERIVVLNGRLKHYSAFGRLRVDVPTSQIAQNSFTTYPFGRGGTVYSVTTPQGSVKWTNEIDDCAYLTRTLETASSRSGFRIGSEQESASPRPQ